MSASINRSICVICMVCFTLGFPEETLQAQVVQDNLWTPNSAVYAVAREGNTVYLGGQFTRISPVTGGGAGLDTSGITDGTFPRIGGTVSAVIADGTGGWYIGGSFTSVGGITRDNLAHIKADRSVDPVWNPSVTGGVSALALSGTTVYVGGIFTAVGGQTRSSIAAVDAVSGNVLNWNPAATGAFPTVDALAVSGTTVYVGGEFVSIGGQSRNNIAAIDGSTGLATAWNPNANFKLYALAVSGDTVYAGGFFNTIGGQSRSRIAALDAATGLATAWNPSANNQVRALAVSGATVYVGGLFTNIGGQNRNHLAALSTATGSATGWNPDADAGSRFVFALAVSGNTVYAGGSFLSAGGQARNRIAALSAVTGLATNWNPDASGAVTGVGGSDVNALAVSGNTVYAGGAFNTIGGTPRNRIAALDATTGALKNWNPNSSAVVYALAVSSDTVYAGGVFTSIGGQSRNRIAALSATTGLATAWNPDASGEVKALALSGTTVYAGGKFSFIGGQTRFYIAAVNALTGTVTTWNPLAGAGNFTEVRALAVSGSAVYVGGDFGSIGGQTRGKIAAVDTATGLATAWNPNVASLTAAVNAIAVSGSTVYLGGQFTTVGGQTRSNIAAADIATGTVSAWNPGASGATNGVQALAVSGTTVYLGGQFTTVGGQSRNNIAALDAATGTALTWNPNLGTVYALAASGSTVYAGGSFESVGGLGVGKSRSNFAGFSAVPPPTTFASVAVPGGVTLNSVTGTGAGVFLAVGEGGAIRYTVNAGAAWQSLTSGSTQSLRGIYTATNFNPVLARGSENSSAFGTAISCGVGGTILRTTDGGATWNAPVSTSNTNTLNDIDGTDGTSFVSRRFQHSVQSPSAFGTAISCGVGGTILRTTDGGATFSANRNASGNTAELRGIALANDFAIFASKSASTQAPTAFGTAISCGVGGTILRTTDGGETWSSVASGTSNDLNDVAYFGNSSLTAKGESGTQSPAAFGTAISCGVGGTILRSTGGGSTWTPVASGVSANLESVYLVTETVGYITGANGTILRTTDGGLTWENLSVNSPEILNSIFVQTDGVGVAVGSNGAAFATLNGGGGSNPLGIEDDPNDDFNPAAPKPVESALSQNYPNPFNPATTIRFTVKAAGIVTLSVYDILGRTVSRQSLTANAGENLYRFNGATLSSGLYFYRMDIKGFSQTKKMLLVK